jgi:hypothetical protein
LTELLLNNKAELKVLDAARRSPEMLARRADHFQVLNIISKFVSSKEADDIPILSFRPFQGIVHAPPPKDTDYDENDFKFPINEAS